MDWKEFWRGEVVTVTPLYDKDRDVAEAMSKALTYAVNNPDTMTPEAQEILRIETERVMRRERARILKLIWAVPAPAGDFDSITIPPTYSGVDKYAATTEESSAIPDHPESAGQTEGADRARD